MRCEHGNGNFKAGKASGFSLLEMIIASAILLVGILSVVQLVPASLRSNLYNRMDTTAMAVAQRELDQMLNQPLTQTSFHDQDNTQVSLGGAGSPGAPLIMQGPTPVIDFGASAVTGFSKTYTDLTTGVTFDIRWAVIPLTNPNVASKPVIGKRIIIGCRRLLGACASTTDPTCQPTLPVTLDTSIQE